MDKIAKVSNWRRLTSANGLNKVVKQGNLLPVPTPECWVTPDPELPRSPDIYCLHWHYAYFIHYSWRHKKWHSSFSFFSPRCIHFCPPSMIKIRSSGFQNTPCFWFWCILHLKPNYGLWKKTKVFQNHAVKHFVFSGITHPRMQQF